MASPGRSHIARQTVRHAMASRMRWYVSMRFRWRRFRLRAPAPSGLLLKVTIQPADFTESNLVLYP